MPLPSPPGRPPGWIPPGQRSPQVIMGGSKVVGVGHRVLASSGAGPSGLIDGHTLSQMMTIMGDRAIRMFLPFFETDAVDDTPVQDVGPRGHHFLKHNTSDQPPYIKGHVLAYRLNGLAPPNGEAFDMADNDDFSMGADGTVPNEPAFTVGIAVRFNDVNENVLISRYDATALALECEYMFETDNFGHVVLRCFDNTPGVHIGRYTDMLTAYGGNDTWYILVGTYDGSCVAGGIRVYINGVQADDSTWNAGGYVAMHNKTVVTAVGYREGLGVLEHFLDGDCWGPFITKKELTAGEVLSLTNIYRKVLRL